MKSSWTDIYRALFGRLIDADEAGAWQEMLDIDFAGRGTDQRGRWTPDELIAAFRRVSEDRRKDGRKGRAPEYAEVKTYIIRKRYEDKKATEAPGDSAKCGLCFKGWLDFWPDWKPEWTSADYEENYCGMVPCVCETGNKWMEKCVDYENDAENKARVNATRPAAVRQAQARLRADGRQGGA